MPNHSSQDLKLENDGSGYPDLEFHLRNTLAETYNLSLPLFALENNKFKIDYHELQKLIYTLNEVDPQQKFSASEFHGLGLLSLISHKLIRLYRNQINPNYISDLTEYLTQKYDPTGLQDLLGSYLSALPTDSFKNAHTGIVEYLQGETHSVPNLHILVEELLVHILALNNPAFEKYDVAFKEAFHQVIKTPDKLLKSIQDWSDASTGFGVDQKNIIELLMEPALNSPDSIEGQLAYISSNWSNYLGSHLGDLLRGLDFFEEEHRFRGLGPGETQIPSYSGDLLAGEYYSEDSDWMPRVVMIARNSLVWLDQLSKRYQREIKTLRDIPDQELDLLAQQGFTVLWLIGLWNRSDISKKIKHWCGNPDAESSAYSLKEYKIDPAIGGTEALEDLKDRAWERGIRLASDMVPNHTGLDADWLKQHPEWYISVPDPPFPAYKFEGGDLSDDPEISIHLEDHYYERSDAAVVFKHDDHRNGKTRFVYHGNDGTTMPWNDTAQLDYLNPELREAIIQTILEVARQFKVIRFDAAMTLAKRHIQRLWYPEPGSGGDIPSRASFSMSGADFNQAIPAEFWREVVDRVATEVPDTLLLAEAFWMMEGYFVRTLGMHRVYNSAFMNMLKMEENSKFYAMIAQTLEFDPRILQRFVNFLSNPDEDTAIAQFGKGDKYFGATVLMVTLPGLPMFAHAQIEGFEEKYGMEYRRAYWNETPDEALIDRHKQQIFPLMKKRYLFAGAGNFRLFPMHNAHGDKLESVFAYTNRSGTERALILVNNAYESQAGWLKTATAVNREPTADDPVHLVEDIIFALSFDVENNYFIIFQEQISKLWFIRSIGELRERGFYSELAGFESQIYLNFQLVSDTESNPWSTIYSELAGTGIADFALLFRSIELEPVHVLLTNFLKFIVRSDELPERSELFIKFAPLFEAMLEMNNKSLLIEEIQELGNSFDEALRGTKLSMVEIPEKVTKSYLQIVAIVYLARQIKAVDLQSESSVVESYSLGSVIESLLQEGGLEDPAGLVATLEHADRHFDFLGRSPAKYFEMILTHQEAQRYLQINRAKDLQWFTKDRMEIFTDIIDLLVHKEIDQDILDDIHQAVHTSEYQLIRFLELIS
ncbi:MAG: alpha-amylase family glycosyl hydrolase [Candidatus Marinimicrobia bacterium]|nr:alpha-amylase family glycosyl hydrolase [Candidatus Neomarinimicrobiota bacterium]